MDARTSIDMEEREQEVIITRIFDAPRHLVFQAWTEPGRVARWWGPQGFVTRSSSRSVSSLLSPGRMRRVNPVTKP